MDRHTGDETRAQAFTLEGFVSAIVILTAVLFALQTVVITPSTGGSVDRAAMAQDEQEVRDIVIVAGEKGNLSDLVRHWEGIEWAGDDAAGPAAYNTSQFRELSHFGKVLDEQVVNASGKSYNVDFIGEDGTSVPIVRMGGGASDSVVTASYMVPIHEEQNLTESKSTGYGFDERDENVDDNSEYPFQPDGEPYTEIGRAHV